MYVYFWMTSWVGQFCVCMSLTLLACVSVSVFVRSRTFHRKVCQWFYFQIEYVLRIYFNLKIDEFHVWQWFWLKSLCSHNNAVFFFSLRWISFHRSILLVILGAHAFVLAETKLCLFIFLLLLKFIHSSILSISIRCLIFHTNRFNILNHDYGFINSRFNNFFFRGWIGYVFYFAYAKIKIYNFNSIRCESHCNL